VFVVAVATETEQLAIVWSHPAWGRDGIDVAASWPMKFVVFLLGLVLGIAGTLAYATFAGSSRLPAPAVLEHDPQLSVTLGEPLVTELIKRSVEDAAGAGARPDLRVRLQDDAILLDADLDVLGRRGHGTATLWPAIKDGKLRIEVAKASLGDLAMPALEQVLEKQINRRIRSLLAGMPVTFTGARVIAGTGFVITCRVDVASLDVGGD